MSADRMLDKECLESNREVNDMISAIEIWCSAGQAFVEKLVALRVLEKTRNRLGRQLTTNARTFLQLKLAGMVVLAQVSDI